MMMMYRKYIITGKKHRIDSGRNLNESEYTEWTE